MCDALFIGAVKMRHFTFSPFMKPFLMNSDRRVVDMTFGANLVKRFLERMPQ